MNVNHFRHDYYKFSKSIFQCCAIYVRACVSKSVLCCTIYLAHVHLYLGIYYYEISNDVCLRNYAITLYIVRRRFTDCSEPFREILSVRKVERTIAYKFLVEKSLSINQFRTIEILISRFQNVLDFLFTDWNYLNQEHERGYGKSIGNCSIRYERRTINGFDYNSTKFPKNAPN